MPKVPIMVEIGGNLVENRCQIDDKKKVGRYLPLVTLPPVSLSLIRRAGYGVGLMSNPFKRG